MLTTTLGAFPKPDYVPVTDWFSNSDGDYTGRYLDQIAAAGDNADALFDRAVREVVTDQVEIGIDIPTDGEIRRENYIHYFVANLRASVLMSSPRLFCGAQPPVWFLRSPLPSQQSTLPTRLL